VGQQRHCPRTRLGRRAEGSIERGERALIREIEAGRIEAIDGRLAEQVLRQGDGRMGGA
jgi:hypothetical protein